MRFMLAERGTPSDLQRLAARGYWFDLKIDGIRALVTLDIDRTGAAGVSMTSRNGLDLCGRYPELVVALRTVAAAEASQHPTPQSGGNVLVLDGEIAVPGPDGFPSWPLTHRRTAQRSRTRRLTADIPAVLYVFDLLQHRGRDLTSRPLRERRAALERLTPAWPASIVATPTSPDAEAIWELVRTHRLEGVIAKNPTGTYVEGRSREWVKIKATQTLSCLVGGVQWAPEAPTEPRSLQLFLVDAGGELVPTGKASAGVAAPLRAALLEGLRNPPLIVEVEYTQVTPSGVLRNPVIRAVRTDLDVLDCSTDQLR